MTLAVAVQMLVSPPADVPRRVSHLAVVPHLAAAIPAAVPQSVKVCLLGCTPVVLPVSAANHLAVVLMHAANPPADVPLHVSHRVDVPLLASQAVDVQILAAASLAAVPQSAAACSTGFVPVALPRTAAAIAAASPLVAVQPLASLPAVVLTEV